jgi:hypothetical protein
MCGDGMTDDFGWEAVTMMRIRDAFHLATMPATMPHTNAFRHPIKLT